MHNEWNAQLSNWTTTKAVVQLLKIFYERKILSTKNYDFLWKIMLETTSGKNRIKGQLPRGTLVAHKTGTSEINEKIISDISKLAWDYFIKKTK